MHQTRLTQEAFDRLSAELEHLQDKGRLTLQRKILTAREEGDLRENAEYHQLKEEQAFLEGRILELRSLLDNCKVGDGPQETHKIDHGVKVTLKDDDGDVDTFVYTSTHNQVKELPVITPQSPLGEALLGRAVGEIVTYEAPGGKFSYEVVAIEIF